jgi:hypothetical protein
MSVIEGYAVSHCPMRSFQVLFLNNNPCAPSCIKMASARCRPLITNQLGIALIGPHNAYAAKHTPMQAHVNAISPTLRSGEIWRSSVSRSRGK